LDIYDVGHRYEIVDIVDFENHGVPLLGIYGIDLHYEIAEIVDFQYHDVH
jgi:hypothetical protein